MSITIPFVIYTYTPRSKEQSGLHLYVAQLACHYSNYIEADANIEYEDQSIPKNQHVHGSDLVMITMYSFVNFVIIRMSQKQGYS